MKPPEGRAAPAVGGESDAVRRDELDPLRAYRERFWMPRLGDGGRDPVYLAGNSLGLQPRAARAAVEQELDDWARLAVEGHFSARNPWYTYHEQFRAPLARLVGARPHEVVLMNGLTANLHLMMVSFYRPTAARHRILIEANAFPSDLYAVQSQIAFHGFDPDESLLVATPRPGEETLRTEDVEALLDREGGSIALVLFGGVNFVTGQLFDISRITRAAHRNGCLAAFDLAHATGNVPLSLHEWDVDFAAWCSYKYLNGGPGAVAACFIHDRHARDDSLPRFAGWWGNDPDTRFRMQLERRFVPVQGADGWQLSNPPVLAMAPLRASLALFDEASMTRLREKSVQLTGYFEALIDERIGGRARLITPRDSSARGCQLSLRIPADGKRVCARLAQRGVICDFRPPDVLRVAPVPLYNSYRDGWRFVDELDRALSGD